MIFRIWGGHAADRAHADGYAQHLAQRVFPRLAAIDGHLDAYLLRRETERGVEVKVVTVWSSFEAIRKFAGSTPERAVIEPEVDELLEQTDEHVSHYDIGLHARAQPPVS